MAEKILVVDDDVDFQYLMSMHLKRRGYEVRNATDPYQALDILKKPNNEIAVLVTDWMMPGMSGNALIREAQKINRQIESIIITSADQMGRIGVLGLGAYIHLAKPLESMMMLSGAVEKALLHRSSKRSTGSLNINALNGNAPSKIKSDDVPKTVEQKLAPNSKPLGTSPFTSPASISGSTNQVPLTSVSDTRSDNGSSTIPEPNPSQKTEKFSQASKATALPSNRLDTTKPINNPNQNATLACKDYSISQFSINHNVICWTLENKSSEKIILRELRLNWPSERNIMQQIILGEETIWNGYDTFSPTLISTSWTSSNRNIEPFSSKKLEFHFAFDALRTGYYLNAVMNNSCQLKVFN